MELMLRVPLQNRKKMRGRKAKHFSQRLAKLDLQSLEDKERKLQEKTAALKGYLSHSAQLAQMLQSQDERARALAWKMHVDGVACRMALYQENQYLLAKKKLLAHQPEELRFPSMEIPLIPLALGISEPPIMERTRSMERSGRHHAPPTEFTDEQRVEALSGARSAFGIKTETQTPNKGNPDQLLPRASNRNGEVAEKKAN